MGVVISFVVEDYEDT